MLDLVAQLLRATYYSYTMTEAPKETGGRTSTSNALTEEERKLCFEALGLRSEEAYSLQRRTRPRGVSPGRPSGI